MIRVYILSITFILFLISCGRKSFPSNHPDFSSAINNEANSDDLSRKVIHRERSNNSLLNLKPGKLTFNICIDRDGNTKSVEYLEKKSTIKFDEDVKIISKDFIKYRFEADPNAPEEECGNYIITISN